MADQNRRELKDEKIVSYFDTLDSLYNCQQEFSDQISSGFFNLSKARYSMGLKAVGALQFDERDMTALAKVDVSPDKSDPEKDLFVLVRDGSSGDNSETQNSTEVRQRQKKSKGQEEEENFDDMDWINEQIKKMGIGPLDGLPPKKPQATPKPANQDPIKWFGVLVPQTLRTSQANFQNAIQLAIEMANLRNKLLMIKETYQEMEKDNDVTKT